MNVFKKLIFLALVACVSIIIFLAIPTDRDKDKRASQKLINSPIASQDQKLENQITPWGIELLNPREKEQSKTE